MSRHANIDLPNGRTLDYEIRFSNQSRGLRLKLAARTGLTVIAPNTLTKQQVVDLVFGKRDWIASRLDQFDEVRHLLTEIQTPRPEAFNLPALAETWRIEYKPTKAKTVGARTDQHGRILVFGQSTDDDLCKAALRRWLARRAKETLAPWLESISSEFDLRFNRLIIKNQRTRWGSCSTAGVISLNAKLLFLTPRLVRYVLIHELCHTLERNHTKRFWTHVRQFEPQTDLLHGQIQEAWKQVPPWAHPTQSGQDNSRNWL